MLVSRRGSGRPLEILVDREPCGAGSESAYVLYLGSPPGAPIAPFASGDYVRDPRGVMPETDRYRRSIDLPADAISTGITNGHATLWVSESLGDDAIIVEVGERFELWPATRAGCGGPA
jgi:hypothetical protein